MKKNIFKEMLSNLKRINLDEQTRNTLLKNILKLKDEKINLMITGATGSGKSSTINALFDMDVAKVGIGTDPETMNIEKHELDNLILWDSPGLGDGKENDIKHSKVIVDKLNELNNDGNPLIDLVLVILDGGSRDLGTSYELINNVIIPNLGEDTEDRILIAINQADVAMKGRYWDYEKNQPEEPLKVFLEEKVDSVKSRVLESTGVETEPIYYSAGYKDGDSMQKPYNLSKLLYYIVEYTPTKKRLSYIDNINTNKEMWSYNDDILEYNEEVKKSFAETVSSHIGAGTALGAAMGGVFGSGGAVVGGAIGAAVGAVTGMISSLFSW